MKIAFLTIDNREHFGDYENETPWFGTAPQALLQGFASLPSLEVHVVSCTRVPMKSPAKLAENIFFHSLRVPKIGWLKTGYAGCILAVRRKLREIRPDIVHGQGTERDSAISAVFSGFPNVLTIHGNMRSVARRNHARPFSFLWIAAILEAYTIPRSNGVVCISNYTLKAVEQMARKTWIVPNAVDASFFEIKRTPTLPPRILCVGNVLPLKNQNTLIRALDDFQAPKNFELVFCGEADRKNSYARDFLDRVAARHWCRYEGFVDREGLKKQLASASGLIHPTLEDNCPMVILEAMAAGVPVAASSIGGIPDLIRNGETGLLFDPADESAMVAAMNSMLANASPESAALARHEALTRFHPKRIAELHLEIYGEVLSPSP
jgi:glycosyltransferase involved in cell wall biosynthesis